MKKAQKKQNSNLKFNILSICIIAVFGIIIYSNTYDNTFHFDDNHDIVENSLIRDIHNPNIWKSGRPVAVFTFALNYHFHELNVHGYHLVNNLIHIIASILVWWLVLLTLSTPYMEKEPISKYKNTIAFFAGMLFVTHPIQTQAVTYIVQRMASLAALFYFLSLTLYLKARLTNAKKKHIYLLYFFSFASGILGMFTKEIVFTLPVAIFLFEFLLFPGIRQRINLKNPAVLIIAGILFSLLLIIPSTFSFDFSLIFRKIEPQQGNLIMLNGKNYLLTQFRVIVTYLRLLICPLHQNVDYQYPIYTSVTQIPVIFSFLLLSILFGAAIFLYKKYRLVSLGIFWFFLTLSVESSIIPIPNVIFEHRLYLPGFGFILALVASMFYILGNKNIRIAQIILILIITTNSFLTYSRNEIWQNDFTLWSDVIKKSPFKVRGYINRGLYFESVNKLQNALADYTQAIDINPHYYKPYNNRGNLFHKNGNSERALIDYTKAISLYPGYAKAYFNRGISYYNLKQYDLAIDDFSKAISLDKRYAKAYYNRSITYASYRKKYKEAWIDLLKAKKYGYSKIDKNFFKSLQKHFKDQNL